MDGVLRGESMNLREPSDLVEVQGRYGVSFSKGSKLKRGRTVDPSHKGRRIYPCIRTSEFRGSNSVNLANGNREITIRDIPKAMRIVWGHRSR
jgi:hypothetical protein